eukprot:57932_1
MLLFTATSLIIIIIESLVHYAQHFTCGCCVKKRSKRSKYCCIIPINDEEEYDFFPVSFLFYLIFMAFLCSLIIVKIFLMYKSWEDRLFQLSYIINYDTNILSNIYKNKYQFNKLHQLDIPKGNLIVYMIDLCIIYGTMILSMLESLFLFYKYYSTVKSAQTLCLVQTQTVLKTYSLYAIPFILMFILQISVYYWLFIIVFIYTTTFNFICTLAFSSLLLGRFKLFEPLDTDIIPQLYFMRNMAIISNIFQSLYITVFLIAYNTNIIYYLPILWSIQCHFSGLNFVRNRQFFSSLTQKCCCCCQYKIKIVCVKRNEPSKPVVNIPTKDESTEGNQNIEITEIISDNKSSNNLNNNKCLDNNINTPKSEPIRTNEEKMNYKLYITDHTKNENTFYSHSMHGTNTNKRPQLKSSPSMHSSQGSISTDGNILAALDPIMSLPEPIQVTKSQSVDVYNTHKTIPNNNNGKLRTVQSFNNKKKGKKNILGIGAIEEHKEMVNFHFNLNVNDVDYR